MSTSEIWIYIPLFIEKQPCIFSPKIKKKNITQNLNMKYGLNMFPK